MLAWNSLVFQATDKDASFLDQTENATSELTIMAKYIQKYEGVTLSHISNVLDTMWLHIKN